MLGLIGAGRWSERYVEATRNVGVEIGPRVRGRSADDCRRMVRDAASGLLDGVIVATEPRHQANIGIACAEANVPVLVEKPFGFTHQAAEAALLARSSWTSPAPFFVDYVHLWSPAFTCLRQQVDRARARGLTVEAIESVGCGPGPYREWSTLHDYGSHDLAMVLTVLGTRAALRWSKSECRDGHGGGKMHTLTGRAGDTLVSVRCGNGAEKKARRLTVRFSDGREVIYDDRAEPGRKCVVDGAPVPCSDQAPLDRVVTDFAEAIQRWRKLGMGDAATLDLSARVARELCVVEGGF